MEELIKLLNEYEETRWTVIDDGLTEEEREGGAVIEEKPTWREYNGHIRHCNANTIAYEKDTFDAYALSKKYGFIEWLVANDKIDYGKCKEYCMWNDLYNNYRITREDSLLAFLSVSKNPISDLISILD